MTAKVGRNAGGLLSTLVGFGFGFKVSFVFVVPSSPNRRSSSVCVDDIGTLTGLVESILGVVAESGRGVFDFGYGVIAMPISALSLFLAK